MSLQGFQTVRDSLKPLHLIMTPPNYVTQRLHSHQAPSNPTIRTPSRSFDSKPLPLLPYMISNPTPLRSIDNPQKLKDESDSINIPLRQFRAESSLELAETCLWIVGRQWQECLGDPNPYRNAREWDREMRKLTPLYKLGWEEDLLKERAEQIWWERRI